MSKRPVASQSKAKAKLTPSRQSSSSSNSKRHGTSLLSLSSLSSPLNSSHSFHRGFEARHFSSGAEDGAVLTPLSKRKSRPFDFRNPYEKDTPQDQDKIAAFLKPLGLDQYADKFVSFDQMLSVRTPILKRDIGMACRERKLLRRKANEFIVSFYYTTGEVYQSKYATRTPISKNRYHRDDSSEDETNYILPAKDGLYRAYLRYPGASYKDNELVQTYEEFRLLNSNNVPLSEERLTRIDKSLTHSLGAVAPHIDPKGTMFLDDLLDADDHIYGGYDSDQGRNEVNMGDFMKEPPRD